MENQLITLTYEIELKPGEKLNLPESLLESVGAGSWIITIQKQEKPPVGTHTHDAFLQGYAPEDEGLYDDYPSHSSHSFKLRSHPEIAPQLNL